MAKKLEPANLREILPMLHHGGVDFIVIGGGAAVVYGLARITLDVDVVYSREIENIRRLVRAVAPSSPYPRDAPPGLPFRFDEGTLRLGMNFTLTTTLGHLDLLGEVVGSGGYLELLPYTEVIESYGLPIRYVTLERLIHLKRAAGRPKDFEVLAELEALKEERDRKGKQS
ncbi:MAG TPA: hypothetical protein VFV87_22545 [Pirellulaceae bacterium]|nr:hypothetical protein [Pirellulaceae bacterium]